MELEQIKVIPAKAKQFESRNIFSVEDLLSFLPRKYNDYSKLTGFLPPDQVSCIMAKVDHVEQRKQDSLLAVCYEKESGIRVNVWWFGAGSWRYRQVSQLVGCTAYVFGKAEYSFDYKSYTITHPEVFDIAPNSLRIYPVYKTIPGMAYSYLTEKMAAALKECRLESEMLPTDILRRADVVSMPEALLYLHSPLTQSQIEKGQKRILLNDLLYFAIENEKNKGGNLLGSAFNVKSSFLTREIESGLPYTLTNGQKETVQRLIESAREGRRLNALIQGDVGCGKTIICALVAAAMIGSGYQVVLMAPTQVLARQHYETFCELFTPRHIPVAFLDTSLKPKEKKSTLESIASGEARIIVGTHSCISKDVTYKNLALTIVDEEHKFGVKQREAIMQKAAAGVHSITMSATPIPRSYAQAVYGDSVQIYTINEKPAGRKDVLTGIGRDEEKTFRFLEAEILQRGHQAYVVCPMIDPNEKTPDVKSVEEVSKKYRDRLEHLGIRIATLTGKDKKEKTEETIRAFQAGEIHILIATTVIEVGVNVPNATTMIISNAERFGLSGLHQLRGRVGRGDAQSYCVLQSNATSGDAAARLQIMCSTNDGFKIAAEDLKLRGPGDFLGTQQSGMNKYVTLMVQYPDMYKQCVGYARELIDRGPKCCKMMREIYGEEGSASA